MKSLGEYSKGLRPYIIGCKKFKNILENQNQNLN